MKIFSFDLSAYLERIGLKAPDTPNIEYLFALHKAHLHTFPFENFDIQLGRNIDITPEAIFNKLVHHKRGGYCFELNGLFHQAVQACSFDSRSLLGRVHITGTPTGRGHQLGLITIEGEQWLCDTGFGKDTPRTPFRFVHNEIQDCAGQQIRLIDAGGFGTMVQSRSDNEWTNLYSFDLEHVCHADSEYGNFYTSQNPNSFFTFARVATLPAENKMLILYNSSITITTESGVETIELAEDDSYIEALKTYFGIELDAHYADLQPITK